jgi:DNA-binding NarL/FixJ family response regulator
MSKNLLTATFGSSFRLEGSLYNEGQDSWNITCRRRDRSTMNTQVHGDIVVLVVDDDSLATDRLAAGLSGFGFRVFTATDVACAIRNTTLYRPHVIVFDIKFLGAEGLNVWRVLWHLSGGHTHSVMYTDSEAALDGFEAHRLGVDLLLPKPARMEELAETIKRAVFGDVSTDAVVAFCHKCQSADDDALAPSELLPGVVNLLSDLSVELLPFSRLAEIARCLTAPHAQSQEVRMIRRYFTDSPSSKMHWLNTSATCCTSSRIRLRWPPIPTTGLSIFEPNFIRQLAAGLIRGIGSHDCGVQSMN